MSFDYVGVLILQLQVTVYVPYLYKISRDVYFADATSQFHHYFLLFYFKIT